MSKTIKVNGTMHTVLNTFSCGPEQEPHTYCFSGGYVYEIGGVWLLQLPGQHPRYVSVEIVSN